MGQKILGQFNSELEAQEICRLLHAAGVSAEIVNDASGGQFPELQMDCGVAIAVDEALFERAVELLEEIEDDL